MKRSERGQRKRKSIHELSLKTCVDCKGMTSPHVPRLYLIHLWYSYHSGATSAARGLFGNSTTPLGIRCSRRPPAALSLSRWYGGLQAGFCNFFIDQHYRNAQWLVSYGSRCCTCLSVAPYRGDHHCRNQRSSDLMVRLWAHRTDRDMPALAVSSSMKTKSPAFADLEVGMLQRIFNFNSPLGTER